MQSLQDLTSDMPFILSFLGMSVIVQMLFGQKVTYYFLLLVLFSMVVMNAGKISATINSFKK